MRKNKMWGIIVLAIILLIILVYFFFSYKKDEAINVKGLIGGEKIGLVESEEFKKIMEKNTI